MITTGLPDPESQRLRLGQNRRVSQEAHLPKDKKLIEFLVDLEMLREANTYGKDFLEKN